MNEGSSEEIGGDRLDELIFASRKFDAFDLIRKQRGCGLGESVMLFSERYRELRAKSSERFVCSHEQYWEGFYS
jgi:hypothetical protein